MAGKPPRCVMQSEGEDVFVLVDGVKVAKRGDPRSPEAEVWVALEPGWSVFYSADGTEIVVERDDAAL